MSVEGFRTMLTYLETFGAGAVISGIAVWWILKSFLPSYIAEKARNLATREDIGRITDEIEKVKVQYAETLQNIIHQNNLLLEEVKGRHQLRLAAVDRRLQAHQDAFALWRKLLYHTSPENMEKFVMDCQKWWDENCLYLSPEARGAFKAAYHEVYHQQRLLSDPNFNADLIIEQLKVINTVGKIITKAVSLPPLAGESEILNKS